MRECLVVVDVPARSGVQDRRICKCVCVRLRESM